MLVDICNTNVHVYEKILGVKEKAFHKYKGGHGLQKKRSKVWQNTLLGVHLQKPSWPNPFSCAIKAKVGKEMQFSCWGLRMMNARYHPLGHPLGLTYKLQYIYSRSKDGEIRVESRWVKTTTGMQKGASQLYRQLMDGMGTLGGCAVRVWQSK